MLSQFLVFLLPFSLAGMAVLVLKMFSSRSPFNGICRQCGEDLPRRGIMKCPWCGRLCIVLRLR